MKNEFNIDEDVEVTVKCMEDGASCVGTRKGVIIKVLAEVGGNMQAGFWMEYSYKIRGMSEWYQESQIKRLQNEDKA